MPNSAFSAVGFDLDGVLINSLDCMAHSWAVVQREFDLAIGFDQYRQYIGLPFVKILENLGIDKNLHKAIAATYFKNTAANRHYITPYPQAIATLDQLKANGIKTFIITSKPRTSTEDLLNHFALKVDCVICADDVSRGKPDPMSGQLAIKQLGLTPQKTAFIGDMVSDYLFAKAVQFKFIYARYGYGSLDCEADDIISIQAIGDVVGLLPINRAEARGPVAQQDRATDS